jgi:PucR family transcriptional regulator, purine catabolism regulatory protein
VVTAVLDGRGLDGVLECLARHVPGLGLVVFDYHGKRLATRPADGRVLRIDPDELWAAITPTWRVERRANLAVGDHPVHVAAVRVGEETEAVLVAVGRRDVVDRELLLLTQGLTGISLELARNRSIRESRRSQVDAVLDEVYEGNLGARDAARQLTRLGLSPGPLRVLAVARPSLPAPSALAAEVEDALAAADVPALVGSRDEVVYALLGGERDGGPDGIVAAARRRGWQGVHVGASRLKPGLDAIGTAMREARRAVTAAAGRAEGRDDEIVTVDIRDLDVDGLVAGLESELELEAFVEQVLGPVIDHERDDPMPLLDTLRAYLAHGCRPGPAAAELCVHRHTLTYRLDRVATLTGRDLRDGDDLLALGFALRVWARLQDPEHDVEQDDR